VRVGLSPERGWKLAHADFLALGTLAATYAVFQQSAATMPDIRRIHAPRRAYGQDTRSAGGVAARP